MGIFNKEKCAFCGRKIEKKDNMLQADAVTGDTNKLVAKISVCEVCMLIIGELTDDELRECNYGEIICRMKWAYDELMERACGSFMKIMAKKAELHPLTEETKEKVPLPVKEVKDTKPVYVR